MLVSELIAELNKQAALTPDPNPEVVSYGTDWFPRDIEKVGLFEGDHVLIAFEGEAPPPQDWSIDFLNSDEFSLIMAYRNAEPEERRAVLNVLRVA